MLSTELLNFNVWKYDQSVAEWDQRSLQGSSDQALSKGRQPIITWGLLPSFKTEFFKGLNIWIVKCC